MPRRAQLFLEHLRVVRTASVHPDSCQVRCPDEGDAIGARRLRLDEITSVEAPVVGPEAPVDAGYADFPLDVRLVAVADRIVRNVNLRIDVNPQQVPVL